MTNVHSPIDWKSIKRVSSRERVTDAAGLGALIEVFDQSPYSSDLRNCLPKRNHSRSLGSYRLALAQIASFIYGHDCLDDLDWFRKDPALEESLGGKAPASRTMGDWLRDFDENHLRRLNQFLTQSAKGYRRSLQKTSADDYRPGPFVIDIDSTDHIQHGKKMEDCAWNYKKNWCLDSQVAFDDLGLCYGVQLRAGNTKSGVQSEDLLDQVYGGMNYRDKKFFRGDSAYCEQDVLSTCLRLGVTFVVGAHEGWTHWRSKVSEVKQWQDWEYSEETKQRAEKRKKTLPRVQLGHAYWSPGWAPNLKFHLIIKREWIEGEQASLFESSGSTGGWHHFAIATNWNLLLSSYQDVMEFYQKRGNAENFIREEKYSYDLKHFPCQKLKANHAFGLLAMVAHNLLRWAALVENPDKPHFSKKLRKRFILVPGKLVSHARQLTLRIPERFYQEVERLHKAMMVTLNPSLDTC